MNASTWTIRNGKLALLSSSGQVTWPSAAEVFDVAFHGSPKIAGLSVVSPFDDLPELSFSRFAAPVAVRISGYLPELSAELGVLADAGIVSVDAGSDSILSGQRWYPVATDDLLIANQWLSERGIRLGADTTIGDIILLRQAADRPFQLVDEALSSPNDIHQIAASHLELMFLTL
jgi:hypothetical protein